MHFRSILNLTVTVLGVAIFANFATGQEAATESPNSTLLPGFQPVSEWLPIMKRKTIELRGKYTNQEGKTGDLVDLFDRPVALTFFYSRCCNARKCAATATSFGKIRNRLHEVGLHNKVRLVMISYEPANDTAELLKSFGLSRGIRFGSEMQMLSVNEKTLNSLLKQLQVPVSRNSGWVSTHGLALYLLDREQRLVRDYHTLMWDTNDVVSDLKRLANKPDSTPAVDAKN